MNIDKYRRYVARMCDYRTRLEVQFYGVLIDNSLQLELYICGDFNDVRRRFYQVLYRTFKTFLRLSRQKSS